MTWGIYLHIPWCRTRCPYCAFNVEVHRPPPFVTYTDALLSQWNSLCTEFSGRASSLYFGGGTPSLHPVAEVRRLVDALRPEDDAEVTLEANPGTVDPALLTGLLHAGINRLSLGIQTFQDQHARFLNRAHSVRDAVALVEIVRRAGFSSWSADLMFALPHQTLDDFQADLDTLLAHEPPHVSLYGLTAEPGTPYTRALKAGRFPPQDEGLWAEMYQLAVETLETADLHRYEVSNFARPGHRSRHNSLYWRAHPYAGLGAGAHGWLPDGRRTIGQISSADFISSPNRFSEEETPGARDAATDLILCTLRHVDGIERKRLRDLGLDITAEALRPWIKGGLLEDDGLNLRLGTAGWTVADALVLRISNALSPLS